jgi:predicted membrane chloride channel (bestrophin family)
MEGTHVYKNRSARACAARSAWGRVHLYCWTFVAKAQAYLATADPNARKLLMRWAIALPYIMRSQLLDNRAGSDSLEDLLTTSEVCSCNAYLDLGE